MLQAGTIETTKTNSCWLLTEAVPLSCLSVCSSLAKKAAAALLGQQQPRPAPSPYTFLRRPMREFVAWRWPMRDHVAWRWPITRAPQNWGNCKKLTLRKAANELTLHPLIAHHITSPLLAAGSEWEKQIAVTATLAALLSGTFQHWCPLDVR